MLKLSQPITSINGFKIGDRVRLKDGDGRLHIIKSFSIDGIKEFFFEVQFEDGTKTMLNNISPLLSNLDEAAKEYMRNYIPFDQCDSRDIIRTFKAGAEWMAGQEQPEVDLEREINACWRNWLSPSNQKEVEGVLPKTEFAMYARHFYGLRNRALEEAARHVYESWMGGTMDDVRRDMVGLGKVLNAREK